MSEEPTPKMSDENTQQETGSQPDPSPQPPVPQSGGQPERNPFELNPKLIGHVEKGQATEEERTRRQIEQK